MNRQYDCLDEQMIPILKNLWKKEIITYWSCEGHDDDFWTAYITFDRNEKFINYLRDNKVNVVKSYSSTLNKSVFSAYAQKSRIFKNDKKSRDKFLDILSNY